VKGKDKGRRRVKRRYFQDKHKTDSASSGTNPLGRDGKPLRCFICDSTDHFRADCPKNTNKGKGKKKAHLAEAQYEYLPAGDMQISGEHHQNSWLVVPKKPTAGFTSYDEDREPTKDGMNPLIDDEDDLPIELIEEARWTKEQWHALTERAKSKSSSSSGQPSKVESVKTTLYPVAEEDRELAVEEESRYTWHTWISYDDEDTTTTSKSYFGASDCLSEGEALLVDTGAYGNLVGSELVKRMVANNSKHGLKPSHTRNIGKVTLGGVGKNTQESHTEVIVPTVVDGVVDNFSAVMIDDSN
jgi:hypothetical protein